MTKRFADEDVFVENSTYARHLIKRRIIKNSLIPYSCQECNNTGRHNGKDLSLQLDHINGLSEDNRLSNLRFLCPNCHSQTSTYAGKSTKGKRNKKPKPNKLKEKLRSDRELWLAVKSDESIHFGKWGWKTRLSDKIGIRSQKVMPWLRRVDPDFAKSYGGAP